MAKATYIKSNPEIVYRVASDGTPVQAGEVVLLGSNTVGVVARDIGKGEEGVVCLKGTFEFPASSLAVSAGAKLYWDATNDVATTTSTSNVYLGVAGNTVSNASSVLVILNI